MNRTPNSCQIFEDVLFRKNKKDGEEETPKCERKFKSAHKRWKSDWYYDEPKTRGTKRRLDVQNNQVNPFLEQEARGFAILQRRHRFMQLLGDEEDPAVTEKRPPAYITQTQQELFQKDVQDLMGRLLEECSRVSKDAGTAMAGFMPGYGTRRNARISEAAVGRRAAAAGNLY
ncbi:hypothetical protein CNMCM7691_001855 [Aspergillus felis]|uniref:Uncharacterized protein n=1 Tax=Aspergillus felis TaxID=1287682 RepID=A0A8H6VCZ3_9EURO|nr:hypothetical protein CNMCM7691_001855 [Aspergillus felis]